MPVNQGLLGTTDNDTLISGAGNDTIIGFEGSDSIKSGGGNDLIYGDSDMVLLDKLPDDSLIHNPYDPLPPGSNNYPSYYEVVSLTYNDTIEAGAGNDTVYAGAGDDSVEAGQGNDYVDGSGGNDVLKGGQGKDILLGDGFNFLPDPVLPAPDAEYIRPVIYVDIDPTTLAQLAGNDTLNGGDGDDILDGGQKNDHLTGAGGKDIFAFGYGGSSSNPLSNIGHDIIADFRHGQDRVNLYGYDLDAADVSAFWHVAGKDVVLYDNANPADWSITIINGAKANGITLGDFDFTSIG